MGARREVLNAVFGAMLTAIFLMAGWLSAENSFWTNCISAFVVYFIARIIALVLGGRGK